MGKIFKDIVGIAIFTAIYNFIIRKVALPLGENAVLGYGDEKIGQLLGITTERVDAFVLEWALPVIGAVLSVLAWHYIFMRPKAVARVAEANPNIQYVITNHFHGGIHTSITYGDEQVRDTPPRPVAQRVRTQDSASTSVFVGNAQSKTETFVEFRPNGSIINSSNVSSITDNGTGNWTINFGRPLNPSTVTINPIGTTPRDYQVTSITSSSSTVEFPGKEPQVIGLRFTSSGTKNEG